MANEEKSGTSPPEQGGMSRRDFLKYAGIAGVGVQLAGVAAASQAAGKDYDSYTGWDNLYEGGGQFFDRAPYRVDKPRYEVVGPTQRVDNRVEGRNHYNRLQDAIENGWTEEDGIEALGEPLRSFYAENPEKLEGALVYVNVAYPKRQEMEEQFEFRFALNNAWGDGYDAVRPARPNAPPEEWDFRDMREEPLEFKSEDHAAELIKKIAHTYGSLLVGITKLNPDWAYGYDVRGGEPGPYEVPDWWTYAVVLAVPLEWDSLQGSPPYYMSQPGYSRVSIAAARLAAFIRRLGYPARDDSPRGGYDLLMPPLCVDSGMAEQGRSCIAVAPEVGNNFRPAAVVTSLPMTVDKPIDAGISDFCMSCKLCAEQCPSDAISYADEPDTVVRGYKRWAVNVEACYNFYTQVSACGLCKTVCPYSRKSNWVHNLSRQVISRDPTGLADPSLTWMQKTLFEIPDPQIYYPPPDGEYAPYRAPAEWVETEKWFKA